MKRGTLLAGLAILVAGAAYASSSMAAEDTKPKPSGGGGGGGGGGSSGGGEVLPPEGSTDPYDYLDADQGERLQKLCGGIECGCDADFLEGFGGLLARIAEAAPDDEDGQAFHTAAEEQLKRLENLDDMICEWDADMSELYFANPDEWWASIQSLAATGLASKDPIEVGYVLRELMSNYPHLAETQQIRTRFGSLYGSWVEARCAAWGANMTRAIQSQDPGNAEGVINQAAGEMAHALNNVAGMAPQADNRLQACFAGIIDRAQGATWRG